MHVDEQGRLAAQADSARSEMGKTADYTPATEPSPPPAAMPLAPGDLAGLARALAEPIEDVPCRGRFALDSDVPPRVGGMGRVWLAHDDRLFRKVGLKEPKPDRDSEAARQRFLAEAQITAQLQHPGIAPVYELVRPEDGSPPYYTMRFVEGQTLAEAAAAFHQARASGTAGDVELRDLLTAFVSMCNTLEYAHVHGVVHRDLKGSNIILGRYGEVVILDWGAAKVVGRPDDSVTEPVAVDVECEPTRGWKGTLAYMAPEQAQEPPGPIDRRTDVFGLGATLYKVLTGHAPYEGRDTIELLERIRNGRVAPVRQRAGRVPKALAAVCEKALATRPEARYQTAAELADEVKRWLADEPLFVYRGTVAQRLGRWARRHRTAVAGLLTLLVTCLAALAMGLALVTREQQRTSQALREREQARQKIRGTLDAVSSEVIDSLLREQSRLTDRHRAFLRKVLTDYEEFSHEPDASPEVRAEVATAYRRMGDIRQRLDEASEAEKAYKTAIDLFARLCEDYPERDLYEVNRIETHLAYASLLNQLRRHGDSETQCRQAEAFASQLLSRSPGNPHPLLLAGTERRLADSLAEQGKQRPAEDYFESARQRLAALHGQDRADVNYRRELAECEYSLGILYEVQQHPSEAEKCYQTSAALFEGLLNEQGLSPSPDLRLSLATSLISWAGLLSRAPATWAQAQKLFDRGLGIQRELVRQYGAVPVFRLKLGRTLGSLATFRLDQGKTDDARALYRDLLDVRQSLVKDYPDNFDFKRELAAGQYDMAQMLFQSKQIREAEAGYREAVIIQEPLWKERPDIAELAAQLSRTLGLLGICALRRNAVDEAENYFLRSLAVQQEIARRRIADLQVRAETGLTFANLGMIAGKGRQDYVAALDWYTKAVMQLRAVLDERPSYDLARSYQTEALARQAATLDRLKRYPEAATAWEELITLETAENRPDIRLHRALSLTRAGSHAEAVALVGEVVNAKGATHERLYDCACVAALAAGAVTGDAGLEEKYAAAALSHLRRAVTAGFTDVKKLEQDHFFTPLRGREEFKELVEKLKAGGRPGKN